MKFKKASQKVNKIPNVDNKTLKVDSYPRFTVHQVLLPPVCASLSWCMLVAPPCTTHLLPSFIRPSGKQRQHMTANTRSMSCFLPMAERTRQPSALIGKVVKFFTPLRSVMFGSEIGNAAPRLSAAETAASNRELFRRRQVERGLRGGSEEAGAGSHRSALSLLQRRLHCESEYAQRCPVLRSRMVPGCRRVQIFDHTRRSGSSLRACYAMSGTGTAYAARISPLRACYVLPGTEKAYAATSQRCPTTGVEDTRGICLRTCYAMSGTDIAYGASLRAWYTTTTRSLDCCAIPCNGIAYGAVCAAAMRCLVLTKRMVCASGPLPTG
eukprot:809936-Rhodomonas_salina.1